MAKNTVQIRNGEIKLVELLILMLEDDVDERGRVIRKGLTAREVAALLI